MKRKLLEKIIGLTLDQVREKGFDLLDELDSTQIQIVADEIEDEVDNFIEELEMEGEYEEAISELHNTSIDNDDDDMIVLDDGPLIHWND